MRLIPKPGPYSFFFFFSSFLEEINGLDPGSKANHTTHRRSPYLVDSIGSNTQKSITNGLFDALY